MADSDRRGRVVAAATDGACSGNPGPGGWGALIRFEDGSVEEFGGVAIVFYGEVLPLATFY